MGKFTTYAAVDVVIKTTGDVSFKNELTVNPWQMEPLSLLRKQAHELKMR